MSRAGATFKFLDGWVGHGIYDGTVDSLYTFMEGTPTAAWSRYQTNRAAGNWDGLAPKCTCGRVPSSCTVQTFYGNGDTWPGTACRKCLVYTGARSEMEYIQQRKRDADESEAQPQLDLAKARKMLWGAVHNAGRGRHRGVRWGHLTETLAIGSTSAQALCEEHGADPDEQVGDEVCPHLCESDADLARERDEAVEQYGQALDVIQLCREAATEYEKKLEAAHELLQEFAGTACQCATAPCTGECYPAKAGRLVD